MEPTEKGVVIVGSGFAAYQLVRMIRRQDRAVPVTVVTADSGDDYSKPDLSHVFSKQQRASDLVKQSAADFASEQNITLLTHTRVEQILREEKCLVTATRTISYDKLVLATGASPFKLPIEGDGVDHMITLNSLQEYDNAHEQLAKAKKVLVVGAGLVGTEIAMDLLSADRKVILNDRAERLIPGLLPEFVANQLFRSLAAEGCDLALGTELVRVNRMEQGFEVLLANGQSYQVDAVISAAGLVPHKQLAEQAGLKTGRGIIVNKQLLTSDSAIYALGDVAEIEGQVMPFLQPIMLSAGALANTLVGKETSVHMPAMLVKVKTPAYPIQLAGRTAGDDLSWKVDVSGQGMLVQSYDEAGQLAGFITTEQRMPEGFPLLRQLPAVIQGV
ncbi:NADH:flavorubredoxin reductase NorW [Endozoicomonas sp. OPT23]|nr:NADH:flavorubredoxin reductase NorW [Endozoicomonas sp. OPT23]